MSSDRLADAMLDHHVSMIEQYGTLCPDCRVGEPHCCPLIQSAYMKRNRRALQILRDLAVLGD